MQYIDWEHCIEQMFQMQIVKQLLVTVSAKASIVHMLTKRNLEIIKHAAVPEEGGNALSLVKINYADCSFSQLKYAWRGSKSVTTRLVLFIKYMACWF